MSRINDVIEFYLQYCKPLQILGGGFKHFSFTPYLGKIPIFTSIFFYWVVQPPTSDLLHQWKNTLRFDAAGALGLHSSMEMEIFGQNNLQMILLMEEIPNNHLSAIKGSRETRWLSTQETVHQGGVSGWFSHISSFFRQTKCKGLFLAICEWYKTRC